MSFAQQGNAGVGQAIAYYTSQGYTVSIPLNDTQKYDLIVDDGESLKRVQVKTTTHVKPSGFYGVTLKTSGSNRSRTRIYPYDHSASEELFVYCSNGDRYLIPNGSFDARSELTLGDRYSEFKLEQ